MLLFNPFLRITFRCCVVSLMLISCNQGNKGSIDIIENNKPIQIADLSKLQSLHSILDEPMPGEWLYGRNEDGQSYKKYINSLPVRPKANENKIYIQPIGTFDQTDKYILKRVQQYVESFFGLETALADIISDSLVPEESQRLHHGIEQLHTKYILNEVLAKSFPNDAMVYMAITSKDLYPKESWNFVFGQAYLKKRVAVSSLFRYKDTSMDTTNCSAYLNRIMKTSTHEIMHMFSIKHCINYECVMNGSISLAEADSKPSWLCPTCLAKIAWCTQFDINNRYNDLINFSEHYYPKKTRFYIKSKQMLLRSN